MISAAPGRPKPSDAPSGADAAGVLGAAPAPGRPKPSDAPSGGRVPYSARGGRT